MAIVVWTEDLSVGVPLLDQHHRKLLELLNELYEVIRRRDAHEVVGHVLKELIDYTHYHFAEEERQMEAAGCPQFAAHILSHRALTGQVEAMMAEFNADSHAVIAAELFEFLSDWLIHHIKTEDKSYQPWLE